MGGDGEREEVWIMEVRTVVRYGVHSCHACCGCGLEGCGDGRRRLWPEGRDDIVYMSNSRNMYGKSDISKKTSPNLRYMEVRYVCSMYK